MQTLVSWILVALYVAGIPSAFRWMTTEKFAESGLGNLLLALGWPMGVLLYAAMTCGPELGEKVGNRLLIRRLLHGYAQYLLWDATPGAGRCSRHSRAEAVN